MAVEIVKPDPYQVLDEAYKFFHKRGWQIKEIPQQNDSGEQTGTVAILVPTDKGAATECGDGRADELENRKMYGPRILGGVNALTASLTGGDLEGYLEAARILRELGYAPGTHSADHGGCGFYDLWKEGKLRTGVFPCEIEKNVLAPRSGMKLGQRVARFMESFGGAHFRYPGEHKEQALRINFEDHTTEKPEGGDRFRVDDWLLRMAGMPPRQRFLQYAESVEQLKADAAKAEFILPKAA